MSELYEFENGYIGSEIHFSSQPTSDGRLLVKITGVLDKPVGVVLGKEKIEQIIKELRKELRALK